MQPVEFRSPVDIERIQYLEEQVKVLTQIKEQAKKDIKRILIHDYETLCEFCALDGRCYCLDKYACKQHCRWHNVTNISDTGDIINECFEK